MSEWQPCPLCGQSRIVSANGIRRHDMFCTALPHLARATNSQKPPSPTPSHSVEAVPGLREALSEALDTATVMPNYANGDDHFDHYVDPDSLIAALASRGLTLAALSQSTPEPIHPNAYDLDLDGEQ